MKKALLIALFFLLSFSSFGQKIHFSDSANVWKTLQIVGGPSSLWVSTVLCSYTGSIVIGTNKYMVLTDFEGTGTLGYIREDTVTNKVYIRYLTDSEDYVLYDYNLLPGDTLTNNINSHPNLSWVIGIDSTQINGIWYKVWSFESGNAYLNYKVVEGIGSLNGLGFPINWGESGLVSEKVLCFQNNGATYPLSKPVPAVVSDPYGHTSYYTFDNATSCTLGTNQIAEKSEHSAVIPNPIDQTSKIVFSYNIVSGSLVIINDIGQTVINTAFQNKDEVLIGDMVNMPGIYFYRVTDNMSNKTFSGKFIYR